MNAKVVSMQNIMSGTQITFLISSSASILTIYNFNQTGSNSEENEIPNTMLLKTFACTIPLLRLLRKEHPT